MLVLEYKLVGKQYQYQAIEEAIRTVNFIRNKCLRLWMDRDHNAALNILRRGLALLSNDTVGHTEIGEDLFLSNAWGEGIRPVADRQSSPNQEPHCCQA
jgi:hypothetical protein